MTTTSSPAQITQKVLEVVLNGQFISAETHKPIEVTEAQMQEAIDPRAKLVDLGKYEGKAILISCKTNDGSFLWGIKCRFCRTYTYSRI
jgi:hypothetical protein